MGVDGESGDRSSDDALRIHKAIEPRGNSHVPCRSESLINGGWEWTAEFGAEGGT